MGSRWVFDGHIAGIGTASGLRAVVGIWQESPFGPFADAMIQQPSGHRQLLAPFGFSSVPPRPGIARVRTTVVES